MPIFPFRKNMNVSYFYYLILLSCVSFGGHFTRSSLSMFGLYMIEDDLISPGGLGLLLGACSLPSMFIPLLVGHSVDKTKREIVITLLLFFFELSGLTLFCSAVYYGSFGLAVCALIIYGTGSSSITVIQRVLVTLFLKENISFSTGVYIAIANIAKVLGKLTIGPAVDSMHSYQQALMIPILACLGSLCCYLAFHASNDHGSIYINIIGGGGGGGGRERRNTEVELMIRKGRVECTVSEDNPLQSSTDAVEGHLIPDITLENYHPTYESCEALSLLVESSSVSKEEKDAPLVVSMPAAFYYLAGIHTLYVLIFHALVNFLPHYVYKAYGGTEADAGYIASIPYVVIVILAPGMGFVVDRVGQRTLFCTGAAFLTVIAYTVLLYTTFNPYVKMALISLPQGLIPLLTLAEISAILPPDLVGIAFGTIEVLDSVVNVFGNIAFGWLYNLTGSYHVGMVTLLCLAWVGFLLLLYKAAVDVLTVSRGCSTVAARGWAHSMPPPRGLYRELNEKVTLSP